MVILDSETERHLYGKWLPFSYDPETCRKTWFCEHEDGRFDTYSEVVVDELVEANRAAFNDSEDKRWGDGKVVASIPMLDYFNKIVPAKQNGDDAYIKRFLNDPDNRAYRTFKGTI